MKKDAYYFSHDSNAKDDPKCVLLIEQLGLEGYGIFWMLLETLRDQPEYKYPIALIPALARRYNTSSQKVEAVIRGYSLFVMEGEEFFFSDSLMRRMKHLENRRNQQIEAGKISAQRRLGTDVQQTFNGRSTGVQPVKESKVNEIKEEESTVVSKRQAFTKPTMEEIIDYLVHEKNKDEFTARGFSDRFYHYYESNGWKVGKNQMKSWKSAVSLWLSKDAENKPKNGLKNDSQKTLTEKHLEINRMLKEKYANESFNNL